MCLLITRHGGWGDIKELQLRLAAAQHLGGLWESPAERGRGKGWGAVSMMSTWLMAGLLASWVVAGVGTKPSLA